MGTNGADTQGDFMDVFVHRMTGNIRFGHGRAADKNGMVSGAPRWIRSAQ